MADNDSNTEISMNLLMVDEKTRHNIEKKLIEKYYKYAIRPDIENLENTCAILIIKDETDGGVSTSIIGDKIMATNVIQHILKNSLIDKLAIPTIDKVQLIADICNSLMAKAQVYMEKLPLSDEEKAGVICSACCDILEKAQEYVGDFMNDDDDNDNDDE